MKDNYIKQSPIPTLSTLGGGANSFSFAGSSGAPAGFVLTLNDTSTPEVVYDMKVGSDGSIYGCGYTQISGCGDTGLVFKTDASGNIKWQRYLCNNGSFNGIALDSSDNVIVVARSASGGYGGNIVKYNSSGVLQWQRTLKETSHYNSFQGVDVDSSDNIYAAGFVQLTSGNGTYRPLVAKYNSSGALQWHRVYWGYLYGYQLSFFYGNYDINCYGCKVDSSGNVHITGRITAQSNSGAYAAKINSSGTWQWTTLARHQNQNPGSGQGFGIDVDSSGNVYICGNGTSPAQYGNQGTDAMLAKFDSSGNYQWINFFGNTSSSDEAKGVVVDSSGGIYLSGMYNTGGNANLGLFIVKFKSSPPGSGNALYGIDQQTDWENSLRNFGFYDSSIYMYANTITLDSDENVYVGGLTNKSTQNWGNTDTEIVLAKVPNDGTLTGTYSFGGSNFIYEADGTTEYNINSYYLDTNAPSNYWNPTGNYVGDTNVTFSDNSSSYTMTDAASTFTDATTSLTAAITPFE